MPGRAGAWRHIVLLIAILSSIHRETRISTRVTCADNGRSHERRRGRHRVATSPYVDVADDERRVDAHFCPLRAGTRSPLNLDRSTTATDSRRCTEANQRVVEDHDEPHVEKYSRGEVAVSRLVRPQGVRPVRLGSIMDRADRGTGRQPPASPAPAGHPHQTRPLPVPAHPRDDRKPALADPLRRHQRRPGRHRDDHQEVPRRRRGRHHRPVPTPARRVSTADATQRPSREDPPLGDADGGCAPSPTNSATASKPSAITP
jgi:hypothetical protein